MIVGLALGAMCTYAGAVLRGVGAGEAARLLASDEPGALARRTLRRWREARFGTELLLRWGALLGVALAVGGFWSLASRPGEGAAALLGGFAAGGSVWGGLAVTVAGLAAVLLVAELLPRAFALGHPGHSKATLAWAAILLFALEAVFGLFLRLVRLVQRNPDAPGTPQNPRLTPADIEEIIERGGAAGVIDEERERMLLRVLDFANITARDVMVPRTFIVGLDINSPLPDVIDVVARERYSRYPVYRGTIDHVVGVLHVKDLMAHLASPEPPPLKSLLRQCIPVPETKPVHDLMREFQSGATHMAVVFDEFGGTAGLVTQEDVVEQVFGDIYDEDDDGERLVTALPEEEGAYLVSARLPITELEELFPVELPASTDVGSVGGVVLDKAGCVPRPGYEVVWEGLRLRVVESDRRRVSRVHVRRDMAPPAADAAPTESPSEAVVGGDEGAAAGG